MVKFWRVMIRFVSFLVWVRCLSILVCVVWGVLDELGLFLVGEVSITLLSICVMPPNIGSIMLNIGILYLL